MAQYSTNANLSTDAVGTNADNDAENGNQSSITGFTVRNNWSFGYYQDFDVALGGDEGGKVVEYSGGGSQRAVLLGQDGLGLFGTADEIDILFRFMIPTSVGTTEGICCMSVDGDNRGYAFEIQSAGNVKFWWCRGSNYQVQIGSTVSKTISADTWYWCHVHRTGSGASTPYAFSWAMYSGAYQSSPSWDRGDGGNGGDTYSDGTAGGVDRQYAGYGGAGVYNQSTVAHFDWISAADGGDSAPGPAGAGGGASGIEVIGNYYRTLLGGS